MFRSGNRGPEVGRPLFKVTQPVRGPASYPGKDLLLTKDRTCQTPSSGADKKCSRVREGRKYHLPRRLSLGKKRGERGCQLGRPLGEALAVGLVCITMVAHPLPIHEARP